MRLNLNEIMRVEKSAFEYSEFGALESVEIGDKLYFPASECAKVLGYHNPRKAIIDHCENTIRLTVPHPQSPSKKLRRTIFPKVICIVSSLVQDFLLQKCFRGG